MDNLTNNLIEFISNNKSIIIDIFDNVIKNKISNSQEIDKSDVLFVHLLTLSYKLKTYQFTNISSQISFFKNIFYYSNKNLILQTNEKIVVKEIYRQWSSIKNNLYLLGIHIDDTKQTESVFIKKHTTPDLIDQNSDCPFENNCYEEQNDNEIEENIIEERYF